MFSFSVAGSNSGKFSKPAVSSSNSNNKSGDSTVGVSIASVFIVDIAFFSGVSNSTIVSSTIGFWFSSVIIGVFTTVFGVEGSSVGIFVVT